MLKKPYSPRLIPSRMSSCIQCGTAVEFKTNPRKFCDSCGVERKRAIARVAMEKQRRKRGISQVKGTIIACDKCGAGIVRRSRSHRFCEECAPIAALELANRIATAKRRADGLQEYGTKLTCANCTAEFSKQHPRHFYCSECMVLQKTNKLPSLRVSYNAWRRLQYADNPKFSINERMRRGILHALGDRKSGRRWESLVGYSISDLMRHLERQFLPDMSWSNRDRWEIDHILPLASFNFDSAEHPEFKAAWGLSNLRPLWADDNYEKRAKRLYLI